MKKTGSCLLLCLMLVCCLALPVQAAGAYPTLNMQMKDKDGSTAIASLQQALKDLGFAVVVDGYFGPATHQAVVGFQQRNGLTISGVADDATQRLLYSGTARDASVPVPVLPGDAGKIGGPDSSQVQLLHWNREVKPAIRKGNTLLVYHPGSGISYQLRVYSPYYHADCEPITFRDTQLMNRAFGGGLPSWNIQIVYVKLPDGRWSLASTHNFPHMTWSINDNGFGGHLCVHFLRDLDETEKNSGPYNMDNQRSLRLAWNRMTGAELDPDKISYGETSYFYVPDVTVAVYQQSFADLAWDSSLGGLAMQAAEKMAKGRLPAMQHEGASWTASATGNQEGMAAALLASSPGLMQADFIGIGCVAATTRAWNYSNTVLYWVAIGMTHQEMQAAFPDKVLPPTTYKRGDASGDQTVNSLDLMEVLNYLLQGIPCTSMDNADANRDHVVDIRDLETIIQMLVH